MPLSCLNDEFARFLRNLNSTRLAGALDTGGCIHSITESVDTPSANMSNFNIAKISRRKNDNTYSCNRARSPRRTPAVTCPAISCQKRDRNKTFQIFHEGNLPEWIPMRKSKSEVSGPRLTSRSRVTTFIAWRISAAKRIMATAWSARGSGSPVAATVYIILRMLSRDRGQTISISCAKLTITVTDSFDLEHPAPLG